MEVRCPIHLWFRMYAKHTDTTGKSSTMTRFCTSFSDVSKPFLLLPSDVLHYGARAPHPSSNSWLSYTLIRNQEKSQPANSSWTSFSYSSNYTPHHLSHPWEAVAPPIPAEFAPAARHGKPNPRSRHRATL